MNAEDVLKEARIQRHTPHRDEIAARGKAARRALADAALERLSPESKYRLAYDSVLAHATLVVLAAGYRVRSRIEHHQLTTPLLRRTAGTTGRVGRARLSAQIAREIYALRTKAKL